MRSHSVGTSAVSSGTRLVRCITLDSCGVRGADQITDGASVAGSPSGARTSTGSEAGSSRVPGTDSASAARSSAGCTGVDPAATNCSGGGSGAGDPGAGGPAAGGSGIATASGTETGGAEPARSGASGAVPSVTADTSAEPSAWRSGGGPCRPVPCAAGSIAAGSIAAGSSGRGSPGEPAEAQTGGPPNAEVTLSPTGPDRSPDRSPKGPEPPSGPALRAAVGLGGGVSPRSWRGSRGAFPDPGAVSQVGSWIHPAPVPACDRSTGLNAPSAINSREGARLWRRCTRSATTMTSSIAARAAAIRSTPTWVILFAGRPLAVNTAPIRLYQRGPPAGIAG